MNEKNKVRIVTIDDRTLMGYIIEDNKDYLEISTLDNRKLYIYKTAISFIEFT